MDKHRQAMRFVEQAELERLRGSADRAAELRRQAYALERAE